MRDNTWFSLRVEILYIQLFVYRMKHSPKIILQLLACCPLLWWFGKSSLQRSSLRLLISLYWLSLGKKEKTHKGKKTKTKPKTILYWNTSVIKSSLFSENFAQETPFYAIYGQRRFDIKCKYKNIRIYMCTCMNTCAHMHIHKQVCLAHAHTHTHTQSLFYSQK